MAFAPLKPITNISNTFFAAMLPNRLHFRRTRFTVLIEVGKLDFQTFKSSAVVFFRFIFASRINDLTVLSLFILGRPILGRFSIVPCVFTFLIIFCTAQLEIFRCFAIVLYDQLSSTFRTTKFLRSVDYFSIFISRIMKYIKL